MSEDDVVEVTVSMVPPSIRAVQDTAALLGMSDMAIINRAVQLYALVELERHVANANLALLYDGRGCLLAFTDDAPHIQAQAGQFVETMKPHPPVSRPRWTWPWRRQ